MGDTGAVKRLLLAAGLSCALALSLAGCTGSAAPKTEALGYHGVEPDPQPSRPEFVLTDTSGRPFDFQARTKGRPTFLYFGYTHCPDACPTAMADLAAALRTAPAATRAKAVVVFVTTDPARDTAPVIRQWLDQFSTGFVGLLGTPQALAQAQLASGVATAATPGPPIPTISGNPDAHPTEPNTPITHKHFGPLGYSVDHSALIFAYDAADRLPVLYPGGVTPTDIADDLPLLVSPTSVH
jgi:protein SCO1/2